MGEFLTLLFWGFLGGFVLLFVLYRVYIGKRRRSRGRRKKVTVIMLKPVYLDGQSVKPEPEQEPP